jgi:DNA polymerase-3 subunit delta
MAKAPATFYILHGDDDFSLQQELNAFRARMNETPNGDLNTSEFEGDSVGVYEIINAVSSYPFLSDKRLVIVKGFLSSITRKGAGETGKKAVEYLLEALPNLPEYARLVFVERQTLSDSNKILKLARDSANGYEKAFAHSGDSTGWIIRRAKDEYGADIIPAAAMMLAEFTQNDLRRADNELLKLVSYVDGERPINEDDVALLTSFVPEAEVFKMVDALAEGKADAALRLLHNLWQHKEEDPFKTYGMIIRQFRLLLTAKEYLVSGGYPAQMADALGMNSFVAKKIAQQSRGFSLAALERIYRALQETDFKMKTGQIEPALALDLLVASLAQ